MNRDTLEQDPCNTCGYEEGSIYCKEHCPHEAKIEQELTEFDEIDFMQEHKKISVTLDLISCDDAISRQAAIKAITNTSGIRGDALNALYDLPSVNPTKTGHWISHHHGCEYECSECHDKQRAKSKYCPSCGAKMVEPQEREE